jgi:hypothetical protein
MRGALRAPYVVLSSVEPTIVHFAAAFSIRDVCQLSCAAIALDNLRTTPQQSTRCSGKMRQF